MKFILEKNQKSQLNDQSILMEDLYKILPLTVDTVFEQAESCIVCIFDTVQDVLTAEQILNQIWEQKSPKINKASTKSNESFLQKLLQTIWCRRQISEDGYKTPEKLKGQELPYNFYKTEQNAIEFSNISNMVKDALSAFDSKLESLR